MKTAAHAKQPHPTKSGPGRYHSSGTKHGAAPVPDKGAGIGHLQRRDELANARRTGKATICARQYRKQRKALARAARSVVAT